MMVRRLTKVVALVLLVSVIGHWAFLVNDRSWADEKPSKKAPPAKPEAQYQEKLKALLAERRTVAKRQFDAWKNRAIRYLANVRAEKKERAGPFGGAEKLRTNPLGKVEGDKYSFIRPSPLPDIQLHLY